MKQIQPAQIIKLIKWLLEFPNSQVCKHLVVLNLLQIFQENGIKEEGTFEELVNQVITCDDSWALGLLDSLSYQLDS
jgi:hypothetical protein